MKNGQGGPIARPAPALLPEDYLLLTAVLLLPWGFGGVVSWAYRTAALMLVAAAAFCVARAGFAGLGLDRRARWLLPAGLLALWAGFQLVPLPPPVVAAVSPTADTIYRDIFPGYGGATVDDPAVWLEERALAAVPEVDGLPEPQRGERFVFQAGGRWSGWRPLSLAPAIGAERLAWYIALLAGFLVARHRCAEREIAKVYGSCLATLFATLGLFGLVYAATSNGKLYWVFLSAAGTSPAGPYVNPNHFAGVMELGAPWLVGWTLHRLVNGRRSGVGPPTPLLVASAVLCVLAGLVTGSSSFPVLLAFGVALLIWLALRTWRGRLLGLGGLVAAGAVGFFLLQALARGPAVQASTDAVGGVAGAASRLLIWRSGLAMFADFPLTGSGFGSVGDVVGQYRPAGAMYRLEQLHNDYLEVLVEGGLVAGLLLAWLTVGWFRRACHPRVLHGSDRANLESAGLLAGLAALALHGAWAFNHQIPGNALLFVTLAAIAVSRGERS